MAMLVSESTGRRWRCYETEDYSDCVAAAMAEKFYEKFMKNLLTWRNLLPARWRWGRRGPNHPTGGLRGLSLRGLLCRFA